MEILPRPGPGVVAGVAPADLDQADLDQPKVSQAKVNQAKVNQAKVNQAKVNQAKVNQAKVNQAKVNQDSELALSVRIWRRSSKDLANEWTPSSSSVAETSAKSMPASASRASRDAAPAGSASIVRAIVAWSRTASIVWAGIVLTVSGPISVSTYSRSGYAGFFVDVDAHSGRWTWAPLAANASQRGPENAWPKCWYASWAWATAAWPRRARIAWSPPSPRPPASCSSRRSISVSTRLTKNDATLCTFDRSVAPDAR